MTDRINAFTVVLDQNFRDDSIEEIMTALRMVKHVISVTPHVAEIADDIAAARTMRGAPGVRARRDILQRLYELIKEYEALPVKS